MSSSMEMTSRVADDHGVRADMAAVEARVGGGETRRGSANWPWTPHEHSGGQKTVSAWLRNLRWRMVFFFGKPRVGSWAFGDLLLFGACIGLLAGAGASWSGDAGGSGKFPQIAMILCFVLVMRNSVQSFLFALAYERGLRWHIYLAYVATATAIFHGIHAMYRKDEWSIFVWINLSGWISTLCLVLLYLTSINFFRRRMFDFFFRSHWLLFLAAAFMAIIHAAGAVAAGLALWGIDLLYREYREFYCLPREADVKVLPGDVIRLTFDKGDLHYQPGQYIFLCVPGLTRLQYHPFSISSAPHTDKVTLHIRVLGGWTRRLMEYVRNKSSVHVLLDGPVGEVNLDIMGATYEHFILVSGGIGITPMQSVCNAIIDQVERGRPVKKLLFVWVAKDIGLMDSMIADPKADPTATMFVPDLLVEHVSSLQDQPSTEIDAEGHFLHTSFHLTQTRTSTFELVRTSESGHRRLIHFGRPDLASYFRKMAAIADGKPVAVLTCGPKQLVADVKRQAKEHSAFHVHEESFEF